ncbi:MAG: signal recognition particle-docking protein FtsY [Ignavibacteriaceae bacterium]|nr:signal recognition particle-docking protein FtsY [Ignavibacteriaceae bacterium]
MALFKNLNFSKLKEGLTKTRNRIFNSINEVISGKAVIDENTIEEIEDILISSDIGYEVVQSVIEEVKKKLKNESDRSGNNVLKLVKNELNQILVASINKTGTDLENSLIKYKPYVILIVGVNGAGKTTTIGKLAHNFKKSGLNVLVGAADTFRAAANDQLEIWAKRAGVSIIQKEHGSDPSSVAFDTIKKAIDEKIDVVLIDTAGRLHTKKNLMDELNKIRRVISKLLEYAPNETLLVLDGNSGQNAIMQSEEFSKVTDISGLIITKLDGTAKGGVVYQICSKKNIPVRYIGVGESIEDLLDFEPETFTNAIFNSNQN